MTQMAELADQDAETIRVMCGTWSGVFSSKLCMQSRDMTNIWNAEIRPTRDENTVSKLKMTLDGINTLDIIDTTGGNRI